MTQISGYMDFFTLQNDHMWGIINTSDSANFVTEKTIILCHSVLLKDEWQLS